LVEVELEPDLPGACLGLEATDARGYELAQRHLAQLERERTCVDLRELEEVVDQRSERLGLLVQGGEVVLGRGQPVLDRLQHRLDRRERRTQVMTRPGDELAARIEEPLDAGRHLVERLAELSELPGAGRGCTRGEVTRGEARGR